MAPPKPINPDSRQPVGRVLKHYRSTNLEPVQLVEVLARLAAVATERAALYGELLAEAFEREGISALVGHKMDVVVVNGVAEHYPVSEETRALVKLEADERKTAERLAVACVKMGIEAKRTDLLRSYGRTVVAVARALVGELGMDWSDDAVRRAAQRAVLAARQELGYELRSPESAGPALSGRELDRVHDRGPTPWDGD